MPSRILKSLLGKTLSVGKFELEELIKNTSRRNFTLRAHDKYGDYGLVGFLGLDSQDKRVMIDAFLLSCRVLGRRVEHAFLSRILTSPIFPPNDPDIFVRFAPSAKNAQVAEFLTSIGFQWSQEEESFMISGASSLDEFIGYPQNYKIEME